MSCIGVEILTDILTMTDNEDGGRRNTSSYMEQENEWERESLLDPAWEIQQKKVCFTSFMLFLVHTDGK